jgi:hypothetical protein
VPPPVLAEADNYEKIISFPTLCLSLFSNTSLVLKSCLVLKSKQEVLCAAGYTWDKETFDLVLNLKYFIQGVKFW